jgi:hypothetical protein
MFADLGIDEDDDNDSDDDFAVPELRGVFQTFQASHNYSQSEQSLPFQSL